ncbi:hypothetical protein ACFX1X_030175 [Malus domestica]
MLKECTKDGMMAIISKQRCVHNVVKSHVSKHIFRLAQDIFKPLPIKLSKDGFSSSRQGSIPRHSSAVDMITKKLKRSPMIITSMVLRIQDKNPRCARLLLRIWLNRVYHLPRYSRRPRLNMHGIVVFCRKSKCLGTSQWCIKLQRRSLILRIAFLCKNGADVALKALKQYHDCKKKKKNQSQDLSSTTNRAATRRSFKACYGSKENQNATQPRNNYAAVSCTTPHDSTPPRENYDQKALHSETPL